MTSLLNQKGLIFDISKVGWEAFSEYFPRRNWGTTNYVLAGYNQYISEVIYNYTMVEPRFEEPTSLIFLDHTHYAQYLMIRHLDWNTIIEYFEPLNLRKPT